MSLKGLRGFKKSAVISPPIRRLVECGLNPTKPTGVELTPTIALSFTSIDEGAATGRYVADIYMIKGKGTYTFTKQADPDSKFTVAFGTVTTAAALDYSTKNNHSITIRATNGTDTIDQTFIINVNNVFENALGPGTASLYYLAAENAVVASITGLDSDISEVITGISPNDGRLTFNNNQILKGPSAVTVGTINATVFTSGGRTLDVTISVVDLIPGISYVSRNYSATTTASYTFTGQAIGEAHGARLVVVVAYLRVSTNGTTALTTVTIGGVTAELVVPSGPGRSDIGGNYVRLAVAFLQVPSGTTADITINTTGTNPSQFGIAVYRVLTADTTPIKNYQTGNTSSAVWAGPSGAGFALWIAAHSLGDTNGAYLSGIVNGTVNATAPYWSSNRLGACGLMDNPATTLTPVMQAHTAYQYMSVGWS